MYFSLLTCLFFWNTIFSTINALSSSSEKSENTKFKLSLLSKQDWQVVNGTESNIYDFPYSVYLYATYNKEWTSCSGTIVSENYFLTACHCVVMQIQSSTGITDIIHIPPNKFIVLAGLDYITIRNVGVNKNTYKIKKVIMHPECEVYPEPHDIAIVKVLEPFKISGKIKPVKLPTGMVDVNALQETNEDCQYAGFGLDINWSLKIKTPFPVILRTLSLKRTYVKYCTDLENEDWVRDEKHLCLYNKFGQVAFGDSGAGLICGKGENKYILGITSTVHNGTPGHPSFTIFTRVDANLDFINNEDFKRVSCANCLKFTLFLKHLVTVLYIYSYLIPDKNI